MYLTVWPWNDNSQKLIIPVSKMLKSQHSHSAHPSLTPPCHIFCQFWNDLANCTKYLCLKRSKQLLATRFKGCPNAEKQEVVFSAKNLPLPQPTKSFLYLTFFWIPCSPPHPLQVSLKPKIFTSSYVYLSTYHVSTTILIWFIIQWSLELAKLSSSYDCLYCQASYNTQNMFQTFCQWPLGSTLWFSQ